MLIHFTTDYVTQKVLNVDANYSQYSLQICFDGWGMLRTVTVSVNIICSPLKASEKLKRMTFSADRGHSLN